MASPTEVLEAAERTVKAYGTQDAVGWGRGVVWALHMLGLLDDPEAEAWKARMLKCRAEIQPFPTEPRRG